MLKTFEAIYENGVLRPLVSLDLRDAQHVQITITDVETSLAPLLSAGEWDAAKRDQISLQEVRAALSSVQGSLADAVVALREDRT